MAGARGGHGGRLGNGEIVAGERTARARPSKGERIRELISACPCENSFYRENYSEKWHFKKLSHSTFSMDINNCVSNHVKWALGGNAGIEAD